MYDTIILGSGPAGYTAAERLALHNKKVLLIEKDRLGGTCLNAGCVPTKTLIHSAKQYVHAREAKKFGVTAGELSFDWAAMQKWKDEVVEKIGKGLEAKLKGLGITIVRGRASIIEAPSSKKACRVRFESLESGIHDTVYEGQTALAAAGSTPVFPPIPGTEHNPLILDSQALLSAPEVPRRLLIIGGGVIGVEFGGLFSALGSEVTIIEMMDEILPFMDREQAALFRRCLRKINFRLGAKVEKIEAGRAYFSGPGGPGMAEGDCILMAAGRKPVLDSLDGLGIAGDRALAVDGRMRTGAAGIWAAGDISGRSLLAHSAFRMAEIAAADMLDFLEGAAGSRTDPPPARSINWDTIPWAVYGLTEAAGVGLTVEEAARRGMETAAASVPMRLSARFAAENTFAGQGAVKLISGPGGRIVGLHATGAYAPEFIWGGAVLIEKGMTLDQLKGTVFPHPTVCELIREAAFQLDRN
jgi:dihydrolipoamide dehydrogenase